MIWKQALRMLRLLLLKKNNKQTHVERGSNPSVYRGKKGSTLLWGEVGAESFKPMDVWHKEKLVGGFNPFEKY